MLSAKSGNRSRLFIDLAAVAALVAADQLLKAVVKEELPYHQSVKVIPGLLNWTYTTNTGGGFSIFSGKTVFLVVLTVILMGILAVMYLRNFFQHWTGRVASLLVIAGGIGNLIDRVFNEGRVIDYIDISPLFDFAIFNFADCCVTVGGVLLCVYILFLHDRDKQEDTAGTETQK